MEITYAAQVTVLPEYSYSFPYAGNTAVTIHVA